jgi:hypothetical protein
MNEQHDDATAPDEEQVRRLLAAAGGSTPELPPDVSGRLDDVLAGLVAERVHAAEGPLPADEVTGATELGERRRRRWPRLLVAAAAVSVLGIGLGNVMDGGVINGDGGGEAATTADSAGSAAEPPTVQRESADQEGAAPAPADEQELDAAKDEFPAGARGYLDARNAPRLRTTSLTLDLQRIEDFGLAVPVADSRARWAQACVRPETAAGDEWLPVRLDGREAVLVLRAAADGRRTAEVFTCDDGDSPAAATTIDAR